MTDTAPFRYGQHVLIKVLDNKPARVVGIGLDEEGWTVNVRYIHESEAKTMKCFPDELSAANICSHCHRSLSGTAFLCWGIDCPQKKKGEQSWPHGSPITG